MLEKAEKPVRVLSVSTLYPNLKEPGKGLFVRHRLRAASHVDSVSLIVPVSGSKGPENADSTWQADGDLRTLWTKWRNIPGVAATAPALLANHLYPLVSLECDRSMPQVLDAQFGYPDGSAVARLAAKFKLPYVMTLRGSEVLHATYWVRRRQIRKAIRGAAAVVAVSERLRQFAILMGAAADRTFVIPNGIDSGVFYIKEHFEYRERLKIGKGSKLVVAAGNLIRLKGFDRLVRAIATISNAGTDVRLIIAGPGGIEPGYEQALRALPAQLSLAEKIEFCGPVTQDSLASLMSAADVFVLSSDREGWPNVVHEAMACGTPVVATDVGAIPDLLANPAFGTIVEPANEDALADGIRSALNREWDRKLISESAQARSWTQAAVELSRVWHEAKLSCG